MERMMDFVRRTWPSYEITEESLQPMWDRYLSGFHDHILVDALREHKADEPDKRGPTWRAVRKIAFRLTCEAKPKDDDGWNEEEHMRSVYAFRERCADARERLLEAGRDATGKAFAIVMQRHQNWKRLVKEPTDPAIVCEVAAELRTGERDG